jgi:hypothetical protein
VMWCANRHVSVLADGLPVSSADWERPLYRRKTTDE